MTTPEVSDPRWSMTASSGADEHRPRGREVVPKGGLLPCIVTSRPQRRLPSPVLVTMRVVVIVVCCAVLGSMPALVDTVSGALP